MKYHIPLKPLNKLQTRAANLAKANEGCMESLLKLQRNVLSAIFVVITGHCILGTLVLYTGQVTSVKANRRPTSFGLYCTRGLNGKALLATQLMPGHNRLT